MERTEVLAALLSFIAMILEEVAGFVSTLALVVVALEYSFVSLRTSWPLRWMRVKVLSFRKKTDCSFVRRD